MAACSGHLQKRQQGFTYLLALAMIAIIGFSLGQAVMVWKTESRRIREAELMDVGDQYRRAIEKYLNAQPNVPVYPRYLEDLTLDPRFPDTRRYLRREWRDPINPKLDWGLIIDPETHGIMGVYSRAPGRPIKQGGFKLPYKEFDDSASYAEWKFFVPPPEKKDKTESRNVSANGTALTADGK